MPIARELEQSVPFLYWRRATALSVLFRLFLRLGPLLAVVAKSTIALGVVGFVCPVLDGGVTKKSFCLVPIDGCHFKGKIQPLKYFALFLTF